MGSLVSYNFPERQYKEILSKIDNILKRENFSFQAADWPHISIVYVDGEISQEQKDEIIKELSDEKPTFKITGWDVFSGKKTKFAYLVLKLQASDRYKKAVLDLRTRLNLPPLDFESIPHASIVRVPKSEEEQLKTFVDDITSVSKESLYAFSPTSTIIWNDFQAVQAGENVEIYEKKNKFIQEFIERNLIETVQSDREIRWLADILMDSLIRGVKKKKAFNGVATSTGQFKDSREWAELEGFMKDWNLTVVFSDPGDTKASGSWVSDAKTIYLAQPEKSSGLWNSLSDFVTKNMGDTLASQIKNEYRTTLVHELTHAFDDYRSEGKFKKSTYRADFEDDKYWIDQIEINARFADTSQYLIGRKLRLDHGDNNFNEYFEQFKKHIRKWEAMPEWVQKRLKGRVYKEYSELSNEEKDIIFVKDVWNNGSPNYPLLEQALKGLIKNPNAKLPEEISSVHLDYRLKDDKAYTKNQVHTFSQLLKDGIKNPEKYDGRMNGIKYILETIQHVLSKNPDTKETIQKYFGLNDDEIDAIKASTSWMEAADNIFEDKFDDEYPLAGSTVDGMEVLQKVDNMDSISASLYNYEILKGIRELSLPEWNADPYKTFYSASDIDKSKDLAEKIKQSNKISPLIVVIGADGPYILEGIHRLVALHILGAKSFPALVVKDLDELEEDTEILYSRKNKDGDLEVKIAKVRDGYSVSLWDLDANEALPYVKIFPTFEAAKKNAESVMDSSFIEDKKTNNVRLYRGLTQKIDNKYDLSKTDARHGYTTWTDNLELAKQYAGKHGFVYYLDLPKSQMGKSYIDENPKSETYGDRVLFYPGKEVGLNDIKGKEFLVYTFHDLYDPSLIKQVSGGLAIETTSYEKGSSNYQRAIEGGWVEGQAKYAANIPHHGPGFVYVNMYDERREEDLVKLFDTNDPISIKITAKYYPKIKDEEDDNYWESGTWVFLDDQGKEHEVPKNVEFYGDEDPIETGDTWKQEVVVERGLSEASPKLNKPMRGDVKKYKVYVNFGDPNMEIKRDDPERRKSFRARHKCDTAKDKTTPRYWSCKFWSKKPVSKIMGESQQNEIINESDRNRFWDEISLETVQVFGISSDTQSGGLSCPTSQSKKFSSQGPKKNQVGLSLECLSSKENTTLVKLDKRLTIESLQSYVTNLVFEQMNLSHLVHEYFADRTDTKSTRKLFLDFFRSPDLSKIEPLDSNVLKGKPGLLRVRLDDSKHRIILLGKLEINYGILYVERIAFFNYDDHKSYAKFLNSVDKGEIEFFENQPTESINQSKIAGLLEKISLETVQVFGVSSDKEEDEGGKVWLNTLHSNRCPTLLQQRELRLSMPILWTRSSKKEFLESMDKKFTMESLQGFAKSLEWNPKDWSHRVHDYFKNKPVYLSKGKKISSDSTRKAFLSLSQDLSLDQIESVNFDPSTGKSGYFRVRIDDSIYRVIIYGFIQYGILWIEYYTFFNYQDDKSYKEFMDKVDSGDVEFHEDNSMINVSNETWYHGGGKKYDVLMPGGGIDGPGIYLTREKKRAEMYAKKDKEGNERPEIHVHEVKVKIDPDKVWYGDKIYDLRQYASEKQLATWIADWIKEYGEKSMFRNGENARLMLGWDDNEELKKRGFQAYLHGDDLIVLDPKVIISLDGKQSESMDEAKKKKKRVVKFAAYYGKGDGKGSPATIPPYRTPGEVSPRLGPSLPGPSGINAPQFGTLAPMVASIDYDSRRLGFSLTECEELP